MNVLPPPKDHTLVMLLMMMLLPQIMTTNGSNIQMMHLDEITITTRQLMKQYGIYLLLPPLLLPPLLLPLFMPLLLAIIYLLQE
jgi:hypothetical protein